MDCTVKNDNTGKVAIIFPKNGRIMDRLSAMALLVKVTELGSMSAAARALNMPLTPSAAILANWRARWAYACWREPPAN
ncbi:hypothetical protein HMPREF0484_0648 [Klebsiella pneumoniae subsp. rhinoscleromatis ATCC 13884]|nr:hypothetical protein HMPREF0484_0648 [Klebsiella pneumoniae subsp. rhinoscleromatis ATCC 13884]